MPTPQRTPPPALRGRRTSFLRGFQGVAPLGQHCAGVPGGHPPGPAPRGGSRGSPPWASTAWRGIARVSANLTRPAGLARLDEGIPEV
ncbi:MAG TPA: hypothetical protein VN767_08435, partial [Streptosporangiaceae bacterium]|nr:hypothetical protein [Streptosporangiaceae bacterium]